MRARGTRNQSSSGAVVSGRVELVPLAEEHLDDLAGLFDDPDVLRFTRLPVPPPPGFAREWLDRYEAGRLDGTREAFAAVDQAARFVGLALAPEIDREGRELGLGYIVAPTARGRGVGSAMLAQLTRWALDELEAERVCLIIDVENRASERVAERCGYVREGVMRSIHLKQGLRIDAALWSRLPSDP
jgi:RimJ/RimL family protein N-acetyltransferase